MFFFFVKKKQTISICFYYKTLFPLITRILRRDDSLAHIFTDDSCYIWLLWRFHQAVDRFFAIEWTEIIYCLKNQLIQNYETDFFSATLFDWSSILGEATMSLSEHEWEQIIRKLSFTLITNKFAVFLSLVFALARIGCSTVWNNIGSAPASSNPDLGQNELVGL